PGEVPGAVGAIGTLTSVAERSPTPVPASKIPCNFAGQSPSNFFTSFRQRIASPARPSISVAACTSIVLLEYGKKSSAPFTHTSRITGLVPPSAPFSHHAPTVIPGSVRGRFFFQVPNKAASAELLAVGPTSSDAVTSLL